MSIKPSRIVISSMKRNQRARGPTSSEQQNDFQNEVIRDLSIIQQEWNNKIVPLMNALPDGALDSSVDAFNNGLDGTTLFANKSATVALSAGRFYNTTAARPNTIFEQLVNLYTHIDDSINTLSLEIEDTGSGLTSEQKAAIGSNIFDPLTSSAGDSLDGIQTVHTGNILQVARDLYGVANPTLNSSGEAELTLSVKDMMEALLALHGGAWDADISLTHSGISASDLITGTLKQDRVGTSSSSVTGQSDSFSGSPSNLAEDLNRLRTLIKEIKGGTSFTEAITAPGTWSPVAAPPVTFSGLLNLKGSEARTDTNPWGLGLSDLATVSDAASATRTFTGQDDVSDASPTYISTYSFSQGSSLESAIGGMASGVNLLDSIVDIAVGDISSLGSTVSGYSALISSFDADIDALNIDNDLLNLTVSGVIADVDLLEAGVAALDVRVDNLEATVSGLAGGSGDVTGPVSSTDNAIARFNLATGKIIQDSSVFIEDSGSILTNSGTALLPAFSFSADPNTGMWNSAPDSVAITTGGTNRWTTSTTEHSASLPIRIRETGSSAATWKGRLLAGGDTVAFLMGEYNSQAWLGAHNAALAAWSDFYINPDGTAKLFLGDMTGNPGITQPAPIVTVDNSTARVGVGTTSPTSIFDIASGQLFVPDGTAALPAIASRNDPNTGLYRVSDNQLGISTDGILRWTTSTTAHTSTLPIAGTSLSLSESLSTAITTITAVSATLDITHHTVLANAVSNAITIELPTAASSTGRIYVIKKTDSTANNVTVDANASTIDGATTRVIATQYESVSIQSDGSNWWIL